MQGLTDEGRAIVEEVARRHGVGTDAVLTLLMALAAGNGSQAQFNHPDLGGMGQWSQGGMIMVGDMFNQGLKYRVDALCTELAGLIRTAPLFAPPSRGPGGGDASVSLFVPGTFGNRWPEELGSPASAGSQNDLHYAVFPATQRLAIERGGQITVYDLADHRISGFSQQQGGDQSLSFTSQYGLVRVSDLRIVAPAGEPVAPPAAQDAAPAPDYPPPPTPTASPSPAQAAGTADDIFAKIERLADLRQKDIITAQEFADKKAELLARL
jgi:hypothetical protein